MEYTIFKKALERVTKSWGGRIESDTHNVIYVYTEVDFHYGTFFFDNEGNLTDVEFYD